MVTTSQSLTFCVQALLERHEAYMADAERDRLDLTSRIEHLEMDNKALEAKNAQTIEENRILLDQLESLNTMVADSEGHIKSLESTLLSSQQLIRRLEGESERAASLERQIAFLEQEQELLHNTLTLTHEEARTAMSRWQRAERGIVDLQEQLERMEKETKEEREKHAEMIGRMEKQRAVEKELNTAAGRLKGAAAAKSSLSNGSNAVSHFVRDLLQDNTHLQQGIVELREMLMNSNDEIQALREQLLYHQPLDEQGPVGPQTTLMAELESKELLDRRASSVSQQLHIHHHYHVTPKQEARKSKKKRHVLTPGVFIPPSGQSLPATPPSASTAGWKPLGSARTPRDSLISTRWSVMSEQPSEITAASSVPSSPRSNHRNSVFDTSMTTDSYPTSPVTSVDPMSPLWRGHRKHASNISNLSFNAPTNFSLDCNPPGQTHTIVEEVDGADEAPETATDESAADDEASSKGQSTANETDPYVDDDPQPARPLRRALSHESVISLTGGLDIHTLRSRPSQLRLRHITHATSITASSTVVASPMLSRESAKRSSVLLRDTYASSPVGSLRAVSGPAPASQAGPSKLSAWAGWRPWKAVSTDSPSRPRERQSKDHSRTPGINQPGSIPGFDEYMAAHQRRDQGKVLPGEVDRDALEEGLAE